MEELSTTCQGPCWGQKTSTKVCGHVAPFPRVWSALRDVKRSCGCSTCITEAGVPKHAQEALKARDQFTGEELLVKFLWIPKKTLKRIENDGRPVGTRTPDLYRVKAANRVAREHTKLPGAAIATLYFQAQPVIV
jgi:hypothetical protein